MYKLLLLSFLSIFLLVACASKPEPKIDDKYTKPAWLKKPNLNGKTGAIGSSRPHIKGRAEQRRLAISRGLDELAFQSGMNVKVELSRKEVSKGQQGYNSSKLGSTQSSNNTTIKAHIEEIWEDPETNEIHIWLLLD